MAMAGVRKSRGNGWPLGRVCPNGRFIAINGAIFASTMAWQGSLLLYCSWRTHTLLRWRQTTGPTFTLLDGWPDSSLASPLFQDSLCLGDGNLSETQRPVRAGVGNVQPLQVISCMMKKTDS